MAIRQSTARVDVPKSDSVAPADRGKVLPELLYDILHLGCPHGEETKVREVLEAKLRKLRRKYETDSAGNLYVRVQGPGNKVPPIMFSAHMDTVHSSMQYVHPVVVEEDKDANKKGQIFGTIRKNDYEYKDIKTGATYTFDQVGEILCPRHSVKWYSVKPDVQNPEHFRMWSHPAKWGDAKEIIEDYEFTRRPIGYTTAPSVLGADDKVGCYIMMMMIENSVPGLYVFHMGEEKGCVGSRHILDNNKDALEGIKQCVAFDRMNYGDVVAFQRGSRTASARFTNALAEALNGTKYIPPLQQFKGDVRGVFTDSAVYSEVIPECTNVSVGYDLQHSEREHFDLPWLEMMLIPALLDIDWTDLPIERDPTKKEPVYNSYSGTTYHGGGVYRNQHTGFQKSYPKSQTKKGEEKEEKVNIPCSSDRQRPEVWQRLGYIPPWLLTDSTPMHKIPDWDPQEGLYVCKQWQMELIIHKWLLQNCKTFTEAATEIYDLVYEMDQLEGQVATVSSFYGLS